MPLTADQTATLRDLHEQLDRKKTVIATLNTKILDDDNEIETEIVQTEEIASTISTAKAKNIQWLTPSSAEVSTTDKTSHPPATPPEHPVREPVLLTRLPKLDLPQFSGNPLFWQAFWDSFETAVHNNAALTGVQKLSYLRAQLKGEAANWVSAYQS